MNQKQVEIIGLTAGEYNTLKAVVLTPDILSKKLIQVVGESGEGKTSLLDLIKIPISGTDAIKKKDILPKGFFTQALLKDGDVKIYIGAKVSEYQRGEKVGDPKFEFYLYSLDDNGKQYTPIIDGVSATASEYTKSLTTDLTFRMADMFSENQSTHRKLIESLFKAELDAMKIDELMESIIKKRTARDSARALCQSQGAYMEQFKNEGLTEQSLQLIHRVDVSEIDGKIIELLMKKDRAVNSFDDAYNLAKMEIDRNREREIQGLKDYGNKLLEEQREDRRQKELAYSSEFEKYKDAVSEKDDLENAATKLKISVENFFDGPCEEVTNAIQKEFERKISLLQLIEPIKQPDNYELTAKIQKVRDDIASFPAPKYPERTAVDTLYIDDEVQKLRDQKVSAERTNALYDRYQLWLTWIEAKSRYEQELDKLRKMYASIDTGVDGLRIVPAETESGRVEPWIMYDGSYDTEFFHNPDKEMRHMFSYSSFQRAVIGVMLQAARLNLKPKALRLAIIDEVAFTEKGVSILSKICEEFNVRLFTGRTIAPEVDKLTDSQILIQGGELFFGNDVSNNCNSENGIPCSN